MARITSIETYRKIRDQGLLSKKRLNVYEILVENGSLTGGELASLYKHVFNDAARHSESIRNRLTELRDLGVIEEQGVRPCSISGRKSIVWAYNGKFPRRISEKQRLKKQITAAKKRLAKLERKFQIKFGEL